MQNKGAHYSKIFRKAGLAWGKGDLQKAMQIVAEGMALAHSQGDMDVAQVLQQDLHRYQRLASEVETGHACSGQSGLSARRLVEARQTGRRAAQAEE